MEKLLFKLQAQARSHPSNSILGRALSQLRYLLNTHVDYPEAEPRYGDLQKCLCMLAAEGLWTPSKDDEDALRALKRQLGLSRERPTHSHSTESHIEASVTNADQHMGGGHLVPSAAVPTQPIDLHRDKVDISTIQMPPLPSSLLLVTSTTSVALPVELLRSLNHTFFLHLLATDPERVLPPGKSLQSVLSAPQTAPQAQDGDLPELEERVKDVVHRAFWKEVVESLSKPTPAVQLSRLRMLYEDLLAALKPLLPQSHPVLVTLSLPLPPTSSPLRSGLMHLQEALIALRQRCAPARDALIDSLIEAVDQVNHLATTEDLARLAAETVKSILELADAMKEDLSQFVMGSVEEKDLKVMITQQAMLREKALVLRLWPPSRLEGIWNSWLVALDASLFPNTSVIEPNRCRWTYRLVQALGNNAPVACPLPNVVVTETDRDSTVVSQEEHSTQEPDNALPPLFFVTCPALLSIQNYLQALVIVASLRSLVRLPTPTPLTIFSDASEDDPPSFTRRIWTLLAASIDTPPNPDDTKIANLADEVVRVRRLFADVSHPFTDEEEARIRAAVDRTLQPRDPVFILLRTRLLRALAEWLVSTRADDANADGHERTSTPLHMQTGRKLQPGKRTQLHLGLEDRNNAFVDWERERPVVPTVKGFEDEVLVKEIAKTFGNIARIVDWTDKIWQDLIETKEIGGFSGATRTST